MAGRPLRRARAAAAQADSALASIKADLLRAPFQKILPLWEAIETELGDAGIAWLGRNDRFYLVTRLLKRADAIHPWLYARCREVELDPDGYLDLWAREHYKSTFITFGGTIQEILNDPEITTGIFSHTKPTAKKFMAQIKLEFETNEELKATYPEVLYQNPQRDSPRWSLENGLIVRRRGNPKEATVEAHGLVDGMPTGAHFALRIYDDVVTLESVNTPEQVAKTTEAWSLSDNLGARDSSGNKRAWHVGTRYSYADSYEHMIQTKALKVRRYPATEDGTRNGRPVFLTDKQWQDVLLKQTTQIVACQQLLDPSAGQQAMFDKAWLRFMDIRPSTLNVYIVCDPAGSHKVGTDATAISVIGIDAAWNWWFLDGYRHKLGLSDRWRALRDLRKGWMSMPGVLNVYVGYERYGVDSDMEYFQIEMQREKSAFDIIEVAWPNDGTKRKIDRIQRLEPVFRAGRFYLPGIYEKETQRQEEMRHLGQPWRIYTPVKRVDENGKLYSLNKCLLDEYLYYPFAPHDDTLDSCSRVFDMDPQAPVVINQALTDPEVYADGV